MRPQGNRSDNIWAALRSSSDARVAAKQEQQRQIALQLQQQGLPLPGRGGIASAGAGTGRGEGSMDGGGYYGPGGGQEPRMAWGDGGAAARMMGRLPPLEPGQQQSPPHPVEQLPPGRPPPAVYLDPLPPRNSPGSPGGGGYGIVLRHSSSAAEDNRLSERLAALEARAAVAEQRASAAEQRAAGAEARAMTLERTTSEMNRAYDMANQRLAGVAGDLQRASSELADLRLRHEGAHANSAQVGAGGGACVLVGGGDSGFGRHSQ
ncbi:hypothetical protein GPECTOR_29g95 [Gonium pectorale]|uniref:Uncharacterized protein n=1 Tax=Gonium pectorale TaxID=33097 RepID=A0A150GEN7_GONPE|nr:hypothetical protein GPECTOR_29g95 [Gonium pectorale]|eukprot:KXZ48321.1 hypothetical protein GPECTOR_29g95 [Gonium pectorale]